MDKYVIVRPDNVALNLIAWDGITEFDYGADVGNFLVKFLPGMTYNPGWIWNGSDFVDPNPPEPEA